MNKIMIFKNEKFGEIRSLKIDNEPWFVGKDIAKALGYTRPSDAISSHVDEEDKLTRQFTVSGQNRNMKIINESGLYSLILGSKLDSAKKFKRWVTSEVLPQIRKTGGYIPINEDMSESEIMAKALMIAQKTIETKDKLIENLQPKSDWFDNFMNSNGVYTSTQVAKLFGMSSAKKFNEVLNDNKLIYKQGKNWMPYANIEDGLFKFIVGSKNNHNYSNLKITPKGVAKISEILNIKLSENDLKLIA